MTGRRLCVAVACAAAGQARAHGFGQRYDLPLPLELYIAGAALVVVLSCLMLAWFVRAVAQADAYPRRDLLVHRPGRWLASPAVVAALRLAAAAIYFLLLYAGFFGNPSPFRNITPLAVWALWWVGMAYVCALVVDLWTVLNPLETLFAAAERAWLRMSGRPLSRGLAMPAWVGAWPALALYLVFLWMEMVWEGSDSPQRIAWAMVAYSVLTWTGMALFGREAWLAHGEVFTRVFGVFARFAPLGVRLQDRRVVQLELRPYAVGLVAREPVHASEVALVIAILAAVSFDGFLETPAWAWLTESLAADADAAAALRSIGLLATPLLFLAVYLGFCFLIALAGRSHGDRGDPRRPTRRIAGLFALTLVPIAIAYHVAHYLSFLAAAWQYMIPLASDPFGYGWNLFGTIAHFVRPGIVDARLVWIVSVVAIVAGHVAAVYLGHVLSMREFRDRRAAMRSQLPMLVLMVAYTMLSLWIIAQPIVNTR